MRNTMKKKKWQYNIWKQKHDSKKEQNFINNKILEQKKKDIQLLQNQIVALKKQQAEKKIKNELIIVKQPRKLFIEKILDPVTTFISYSTNVFVCFSFFLWFTSLSCIVIIIMVFLTITAHMMRNFRPFPHHGDAYHSVFGKMRKNDPDLKARYIPGQIIKKQRIKHVDKKEKL